MSTDLYASYHEQYMNINTKLKKRFMRKPNISEATNEFIALAIQCEHCEQPTFAGQAYTGAAKCEASAGNFLGEAEHYLAAARQFMKAEKKLHNLKFHSIDRENLEAAIGCFMLAMGKYPENSPIRTSILLELASELVTLDLKLEALHYYEQALSNIDDKNQKLMCMSNILNLQIECEKYDYALETANAISELSPISEDFLSEIQVSRILLSLLVRPAEETKPESLKQLIKDLLNDNDDTVCPFNPNLMLKLQSIILTYETVDVAGFTRVASDTKEYLTTYQIDLLDTLVKELRKRLY